MKYFVFILQFFLISCDGQELNVISVNDNCTIAQSQLTKERLEKQTEYKLKGFRVKERNFAKRRIF